MTAGAAPWCAAASRRYSVTSFIGSPSESHHSCDAIALDLGCSRIERSGQGVAELLFDSAFSGVSIAAEDLHGGERGFEIALAGEELRDGDVHGDVFVALYSRGGSIE